MTLFVIELRELVFFGAGFYCGLPEDAYLIVFFQNVDDNPIVDQRSKIVQQFAHVVGACKAMVHFSNNEIMLLMVGIKLRIFPLLH